LSGRSIVGETGLDAFDAKLVVLRTARPPGEQQQTGGLVSDRDGRDDRTDSHPQGETISTAFVESTINQVVSGRSIKK